MNLDVTFEETNQEMDADFGEIQVVEDGGGSVNPEEIERFVNKYLEENPPAPGPAGEKGDPGVDGKDGFSPTIKVDEQTNGHRVAVSDANGTQTFFVPNGVDGYTPKKGVDYYTEADKTEMVSAVLAALPIYQGEVEDV